MLQVDLHMHTHFSPDSGALSKSIVARCINTGLNYIAVTDHNVPPELGRAYMEVPELGGTPQSLKDALSQARLVRRKAHRILR